MTRCRSVRSWARAGARIGSACTKPSRSIAAQRSTGAKRLRAWHSGAGRRRRRGMASRSVRGSACRHDDGTGDRRTGGRKTRTGVSAILRVRTTPNAAIVQATWLVITQEPPEGPRAWTVGRTADKPGFAGGSQNSCSDRWRGDAGATCVARPAASFAPARHDAATARRNDVRADVPACGLPLLGRSRSRCRR